MAVTLRRLAVTLLVAFVVFAPAPAADDPRQPLTPPEQAAVNRAIAQGVAFLRAAELPTGTWAEPKKPHQVGYAALPALTLLECGVPANDPAIVRAAAFVRQHGPTLDTTYEVSLAILFLDRLNDPRDKGLIQTLAARLIVGQSNTGGWGYKVPTLTPNQHQEFVALLRRAYPTTTPVVDQRPKPGGNDTVTMKDLKPPGTQPGTTTGSKPPADTITAGPNESPGYTASNDAAAQAWVGDARRRLCLKTAEAPPPEPRPARPPQPANPQVKAPEWNIPQAKPVVIPQQWQGLTVFQDPSRLVLEDPSGRAMQPLAATTDNSNTQFAILALWAAQRHDVPMERTLMLIAHRFVTSQNKDGSWDYHYKFGGSNAYRPAMTAVGLLGLAVGHGLNNRDADGKAKGLQDPRILQGFVALNQHVGKPSGQWQNREMVNLYVLWSIERVAVLYNLATIGEKDWYRWGAEILVANQQPRGNWDRGGYHGASPVIDTCFALLFLKRANLVEDLTGRLPFDTENLTTSITASVNAEGAAEKSAPPADSTPVVSPKDGDRLEGAPTVPGKDPGSEATRPTSGAPGDSTASDDAPATGGRKWLVLLILLGVVLLGLLLCVIAACVIWRVGGRRKGRARDDERPPHRRPATAAAVRRTSS
jgi:hypothetical protein